MPLAVDRLGAIAAHLRDVDHALAEWLTEAVAMMRKGATLETALGLAHGYTAVCRQQIQDAALAALAAAAPGSALQQTRGGLGSPARSPHTRLGDGDGIGRTGVGRMVSLGTCSTCYRLRLRCRHVASGGCCQCWPTTMMFWPTVRGDKIDMAILPRKPLPADPVIVPLIDHPEYQRLAALRRALSAGLADRQREVDLAAIEAGLARPTSGSARGPRADQMRARAEQLRRALPQPVEPAASPNGLPASIVTALALLQDGKVVAPQDRATRLKQIREELKILEAAQTGVTILLAELRSDQTAEMANRLLAGHREALRQIYEAGVAFSAAVQAEREIIVGLINAEYDAAEHILQRPGFPAASRIGTLKEHDTEISFYRRRLEAQGIV
jgi:hypothetical protein